MRYSTQAKTAVLYGIDIGKSQFHVAGLDPAGHLVLRTKFRRSALLQFFSNVPVATVAMEACPGSQWLARKLASYGHSSKIVPAQFVKPYVKSNKNDTVDAEAIAEAASRPSMRFVAMKRPDQIDLQALHRARDGLVSQRTALVNQMRGFLLEYGVACRTGVGAFKLDLADTLGDAENDLTPAFRHLLACLRTFLTELEDHIEQFNQEIEAFADRDDTARRLMTIPGIGPLAATALLAATGDAHQFKRGRDLSAWLGLVPAQYSTGGKSKLLGISKRGNAYIRRLLIHGARSCVVHTDRSRHRWGTWLDALAGRVHVNKLTVALANKIARMAWVVLTKPGATYQRQDPRFAA